MNKRASVGRAFTLLTASAIIAMVLTLFIFGSSATLTKQAQDIKVEMGALSTAGQLRNFAAMHANDVLEGKHANIEFGIKQAYGPTAKFGLHIDDKLVAGEGLEKPDARFETLMPAYNGKTFKLKLEVKR